MILDRTQLADFLGCSLPSIDQRVRRGMPYRTRGARGRQWEFDSADVVLWEKDAAVKNAIGDVDKADEVELKRRKLAAETTIVEIEAARSRGQVADLKEVERAWSGLFAAFQSRMMQIPARVAASLVGESSETTIKEVLLDEIREALTALGNEQ